MTQNNTTNQPGEQRTALLAEIEAAEKANEAFNASLLNHKQLYPGAAIAFLILLYLGMIEPLAQTTAWVMIGLLAVALVGITFWKRRQADILNARLEAANQAFKEYERSRRKKRRKK